MSDPVNGSSKNGKRRRPSKNSHGSKDNKNNNGNSNGESLLAPLLPYEQTKIDTITVEYEQTRTKYSERIDEFNQRKEIFKKDFKTAIEVYKKVTGLKGEGLSGIISEESTYVRIKGEFDQFEELEKSSTKI